MKYSKHLDDENFEKNLFGREAIKLKIPKATNILIVTTMSDAIDGAASITTKTYDFEEIEEMLLESEE